MSHARPSAAVRSSALFAALLLQLAACATSEDRSGGGSGGISTGSGGAGSGGAPSGAGGVAAGGSGGAVDPEGSGGGALSGTGGAGTGGQMDGGGPDRKATPDTRPPADAVVLPPDGGPPSNPEVDALCTPKVVLNNMFPDTAGGMRFNSHVPDIAATMVAHSRAICRLIFRTPADVKRVPMITVVINNMDGVANTGGGTIRFSGNYIGGIRGTDAAIAFEINGVLVHEATHAWQYNNGGGNLVEAMADYVRYKAGFDRLARRRVGGNWSDPYTTGGFFIAWVEDKYDKDWGYKINMGMKTPGFNYASFIQATFGKTADALWAEYQAAIR